MILCYSLLTGTLGWPAAVVTELKTIPQMRSTHTDGVPTYDQIALKHVYSSFDTVLYSQTLFLNFFSLPEKIMLSFVAKLVIHLCFYEERLKMSIRQWNCTWNDIWKLTWTLGSFELVAHGIVIQSVVHEVPTTDPTAGLPPVMLNDMAGVFTKMKLLIYHVAIFEVFLSIAFCNGVWGI